MSDPEKFGEMVAVKVLHQWVEVEMRKSTDYFLKNSGGKRKEWKEMIA